MNRRQKIIVSITGIFIVLLALVGLTYAYFLTRITGNENDKSISVITANLELVYGDGNNLVTAANIEPGDPITPKTFTVTNNGNATVEDFNIYLEDVINQLSRKTDLVYTITCENTTEGATSTECEDFEVIENEVNGTELVFPSVMSIIARDTLEPATETTNAEQHTYTLTVTYKEMNVDQSEDMNKEVSAKINIYDSKTKFLATEIMNNVLAGTGTKFVEPNMLGVVENTTVPAEQASLENERVLSYTLDDYGTSYYYRGNVEDNYVNFAGMCWRILRINGDKSIRLILEDQYTTCDDNSYTGNWVIGQGNYGYDSTTKSTSGSTLNKKNYLEPKSAADKSMVKTFYDFQTTGKLKDYITKLKVGDWCLEDKAYLSNKIDLNNTTPLSKEEINSNYLSKNSFYYDSLVRLNGNNGYHPTLKCNGIIMNKFKSVIYDESEIIKESPMYVSAITLDEIIYAGGKYQSNIDNYLINNYQKNSGSNFGSISLDSFSGGINGDTIFIVMYDNDMMSVNANSANINITFVNLNIVRFRPVIFLAPNVISTTKTDIATYGQPGTINNPYVIN